jgi:glycerophosphoryl diester phosphodiesterase
MKRFVTSVLLASGLALGLAAQPLVIAHRGASGYLPEHTLAAKALAHGMRADFIEQDLVLSKDGVPMVLHDIFVDTVTDVAQRFPGRRRGDGRYYALDFTAGELKQLQVTERISLKTGRPVYPGRFPAGQSTFHLSTFEEELQLIRGLNRSTGRTVGIYPEIKQPRWHQDQGQDLSRAVVALLARYGYAAKSDGCWLQCFDYDEVRRLRHELNWRGNLVLLVGGDDARGRGSNPVELLTPTGLRELAKTAEGLGPPISQIVTWTSVGERHVTNLTNLAHAANLVVHPYTMRLDGLPEGCASSDQLHEALFVAAGVDGVFTDFPDVTVQWLEQHSNAKGKR